MKALALIVIGSVVVSILGAVAVTYYQPDIVTFYQKNLRSIFFSGFLTLSGFMLSMMTFVIIKVKEGIYDGEEYLKRIKKAREDGANIPIYGPVKRLGMLLFATTISSVVCSALQVTIGFSSTKIMVCIALGSAWFSFSLMLASLVVIIIVLNDYFQCIEDDGNAKING